VPIEMHTVLVQWRSIEHTGMQGTKALQSRMGDLISASLGLGRVHYGHAKELLL